jgi:uncharacterized protein (TIGR00645 family)
VSTSFSRPPPSPSVLKLLGEIIYAIRWPLVPMYIGMWVAIIGYNVKFFVEIIDFLQLHHKTTADYLMWVLGLVDVTMIGNLIVMTTIGGFSTFVREYQLDELDRRPRWMNGLDSSTLKIKMAMSLVAVSAIHLLQTFMDAEHVNWDVVGKQVLIHCVFMITTLIFTFNARLMPHKQEPHA